MRFKELELNGFKTFASRSEFAFAEKITAIVGPNGSGKSNIADAVRWVLGEQSYKLLRGRKTVDMIFSGSEERARAGMASATVVFDNSDGWLPIDFSEVSITRKAYRDGKNEYYINGQQVLLRDVNELLGQSGLAERTYTIIGQGLVDSALALKAEERRALFEEAAGIGLYRSRREDAERRLEKTHRNLDRVEDILAELKPRLRSLEKQSRRYQQHAQVKADLRMLMRDWYGYHWARVQKELAEAREGEQTRHRVLVKAREKQAALDQELSEYQSDVQGLRARLNSWHRQLSQYHTDREKISRELAVADERLRSLQQQREEVRLEITRLEEEAQLAQGRLQKAKKQVATQEETLTEAQAHGKAAQEEWQHKQNQRNQLQKQIESRQETLVELENKHSRILARIEERRTSLERLRASLTDQDSRMEQMEEGIQEAQQKRDRARDERDRLVSKRQEQEEALNAQQDRIETWEEKHRAARKRLSDLQTEISRRKAQIKVLEQAETKLIGYASGARTLLKGAQKGKLTGVLGALSANVQVDQEYEIAIAAALGEYLDAVVLETGLASQAALELLLEQSTRGAMLPLDDLVPPEPLQKLNQDLPGLIGLAADLVKTTPKFRPAVDLLLGQVIVLRDRRAVKRALAGQPAGARAVTLQGEVFYATGQVFAGQEGDPSTLSRSRQVREEQARLREKQEQEEALKNDIREAEERLSDLNRELRSSRESLQRVKQREKEAEEASHQARLAYEQAAQKASWEKERLQSLEGEIKAGQEDIKKMESEAKELRASVTKTQEALREDQIALKEFSLEEHRQQVSYWETQAAVAERALSDVRERLQERKTTWEDYRQRLKTLGERKESLETEIRSLKTRSAQLQEDEQKIMVEIEEVRALIEPTEENLEGSTGKQQRLRKAEAEARRVLNRQERHYAQAQIALTRAKENLETMRERIKEDIGLVELTYEDDMTGPTPLPLDGWVEKLPEVESIPDGLGDTIQDLRGQLRRLGAVNPEAQKEYLEVKERFEFLTEQLSDLRKAEADLKEVIAELEVLMEREFRKTFDAVATEFRQIFTRLFGGGEGKLVLSDPDEMAVTGVDIEARLPGRRAQGLSLLSGGERSLTAAALIFSLIKVSPTPFCILDEVDAMLDEANVTRYRELLRELSDETQFILITHNRNTVQAADVIYGITMNPDSTSQVISLKLDEVEDIV
jgi:chromosome segregation protein